MYSKEAVIDANIKVHSNVAAVYHNEPHFRKENILRVRKVLKSLQTQSDGKKLLDIGCGTGFIIDIAKDYFPYIRGIDITPAMIEKVNINSTKSDIKVQIADSSELPFEDGIFDICTCHAVLHHLHDIEPTLKEAYRVLRPSGILYTDLDPNYYFWHEIAKVPFGKEFSQIVRREFDATVNKVDGLEQEFEIDKATLIRAEPLKHEMGGFKEEEIIKILEDCGFRTIKIKYEWFLGEGKVIHDEQTRHCSNEIRDFLYELMPLSRHLFKYISIYAIK